MKYRIDVLDRDKKRACELTGLTRANLFEQVNGIALLEIETVERNAWEYIRAGTGFLRLHADSSADFGTFRIIETVLKRTGERPSMTVAARHIMGGTASEIFADVVDCLNFTPQELMELVLSHSVFETGTVEPAGEIPYVRFEYETALDCLLRICSLTGGELSCDETAGEISLLNRIGADNGAVFRYGLNLSGAERQINTSRMANRIYGVGGGSPPLLLSSATDSGGTNYVEDEYSVAEYGPSGGVYHDSLLENVGNLVSCPALDGSYTGGLCEGWRAAGSPDVSRNEDAAYRLYGKYSQHVAASTDGQGVQQAVSVCPGSVYSLSATLFVVSGAVRVQVCDGSALYKRIQPVTGSGFVTVSLENWKAYSSSVTVQIIQEGAGPAAFYLDSVQVAEGVRVKPFTVGKSADKLWYDTMEQLMAQKEPDITYKIELRNIQCGKNCGGMQNSFALGDTVRVIDPVLGVDVSTRVMERDVDILRPWQVEVRLDNASRTLADVVAALREAQEKGIRRQRALLAESSKAAEAGSVRLGFKNSAFRFYSTVSVVSWNSLSWAAGTLRVGDGWYTITAGTVSGLAAWSTCYFYFDRTAPTAISYTLSGSDAEGEDRILLFAVTTTDSSELCAVHPSGVIHI